MSAAERFSRFFARRRHWFAAGIAIVTAFFAVEMRLFDASVTKPWRPLTVLACAA